VNTLRNQASRGVITLLLGRLQQSARLMCGLPDYDAYVAHLRTIHPDQAIPSYEMFFRARQDARYARGMARCC
jgi:uncharacterized short protein YbdD (DUF466 family)